MKNFANKIIVITGAGSGMGRAYAQLLRMPVYLLHVAILGFTNPDPLVAARERLHAALR